MSLAYPGSSSTLLDIVSRDAFLDALDDPKLRVRIMEREPPTLDEALSLACRLEAYDLCTGNTQNTAKTGGDYANAKPKYVKATSGDSRTPNQTVRDTSLESKLCKQLDALQAVLDHCQNAILSQMCNWLPRATK